jgi:hypothetical protein
MYVIVSYIIACMSFDTMKIGMTHILLPICVSFWWKNTITGLEAMPTWEYSVITLLYFEMEENGWQIKKNGVTIKVYCETACPV